MSSSAAMDAVVNATEQEREGRSERRGKSESKIRRGLRSLSKTFKKPVFQLPKVFRARGGLNDTGSMHTPSKKKKKASKLKKKLMDEEKNRKPAPEVTKDLETMLNSGNFAIWLGEDFPSAKNLVDSRAFDVLTEMAELVDITKPETKKELLSLLNDKKSGDVQSKIQSAKDKLIEHLGLARFNAFVTESLMTKLETRKDFYLAVSLVKVLNPDVIIYTGCDRNLEEQLQHDNTPYQSLTGFELLSKKYSSYDSIKKNVGEEATLILKPNGDYTKPDSLAFTKKERFENLGVNAGEEKKEEGKAMNNVLTEVAAKMPILFIGNLLLDSEPVSAWLKDCKKEEEEPKHFALVSATNTKNMRPQSKEVGLSYLVYKPDKRHSQLEEFLSKCVDAKTSSSEIPSLLSPNSIVTTAVCGKDKLEKFVQQMTEKEKMSKSITFFVNDLRDLPIVGASPWAARSKMFNEKLTTEGHEDKVRVLLPLSSNNLFIEESTSESCEQGDRLLSAIKDSAGKLELRFVETNQSPEDFEFFFLETTKGDGVGDICLAHSLSSKKLNVSVSLFEVNSNLSEEKALLFERMWNSALSMKESEKTLEETLGLAREGLKKKQAQEKKKEGRLKFFGSKNTKDNKKEEEEETKKGPGVMKKIMRTLSRSKKTTTEEEGEKEEQENKEVSLPPATPEEEENKEVKKKEEEKEEEPTKKEDVDKKEEEDVEKKDVPKKKKGKGFWEKAKTLGRKNKEEAVVAVVEAEV